MTAELKVIPIHRRKKKYDISGSYDGVDVASRRFKDLYERSGMTGLQFKELGDDAFAIRATNVVAFDAVRRGTKFEKKCDACGIYESVTGATPVYLLPGEVVPDMGFARTDLEFASGDEKHPLLLCGEGVAKILWAAKLKGIVLQKVKT
ncbi:MAG TPA: hypothetical protein PK156_28870 [Polyangium sp.]|nr:hypothetical protein [Polyangium sp.]